MERLSVVAEHSQLPVLGTDVGERYRVGSARRGGSLSVVAIPAGLPWPVVLAENRGGIVGPGFSTKIHQEVLPRCPVTSLPCPS